MGKITVKHYLNTDLKPNIIGSEKHYKLYFLIRFQNKNTKIKSLLDLETTEIEYNAIVENKNSIYNKWIINEVDMIEKIIFNIEALKIPFDIKVFNDFWQIAKYPIIERFKEYIKWVYDKDRNLSLYGTGIDSYQEMNHKTLVELYSKLHSFSSDNELLINNELYYGMLNKYLSKEINNFLKDLASIDIWEIDEITKEVFKKSDILRIAYSPKKYNAIDYILKSLLKENKFNLEISKCITGNIGDNKNYLNNIINSYSVGK